MTDSKSECVFSTQHFNSFGMPMHYALGKPNTSRWNEQKNYCINVQWQYESVQSKKKTFYLLFLWDEGLDVW